MTNKHRILMLCAHYAESNHANSICVQNMAEEFVLEGHYVFVIARGSSNKMPTEEIKNGVNIKRMKEKLSTRFDLWASSKKWGACLIRIFHIFRYAYTLFIYPNVSPLTSRKMRLLASEVIKKNNIDTIIATYRPYESIAAALEIKEQLNNKITLVTYHLDLMNSPNNRSSLVVTVKKKKNIKAIDRELKIVDKILLPNSAARIEHNKIKYVDFPMFVSNKTADKSYKVEAFDNQCVNVAYVGSLDSHNRNPERAIQLFQNIGKVFNKKVILHIWGKLSDSETKSLLSDSLGDSIKYHGMIEPNKVLSVLKQSDFLLNICNSITYKMVPSKIFQYFASGKPIICLVGNKEDSSLVYFRKYGNCIEIPNNLCSEEMSKMASGFMNEQKGKAFVISPNLFHECTPEYICSVCL